MINAMYKHFIYNKAIQVTNHNRCGQKKVPYHMN